MGEFNANRALVNNLNIFKMKLAILGICLTIIYFFDQTKSFSIRPDGLKSEVSGPIQTMIDRDLGPMDVLERFERSPMKHKKKKKKKRKGSREKSCEEKSREKSKSKEKSKERPGKKSRKRPGRGSKERPGKPSRERPGKGSREKSKEMCEDLESE